ncbi:MAG: DUF1566 domain-containing protein [Campylobacterales bacterium]|nr:DUF1566 domain-containing protein [Campylobacterales bacterium]
MKWFMLLFTAQILLGAEFVSDVKKHVVLQPTAKLIWEDDEFSSSQKMSFKIAMAYCEILNLDGMNQWRLPTIEELSGIVDMRRTPSVYSDFYHTSSECYWSTIQKPESGVGFIDFSNGMKTTGLGFAQECHPRCVHSVK